MSDLVSPSTLVDKFGRKIEYLRISVTDRCDLRCVYCMSEDMKFMPRAQLPVSYTHLTLPTTPYV